MEKLELKRQLFHLCLGVAIVFLLYLKILNPVILSIVFLTGFAIALLSLRTEIPVVSWFLKNFDRPGGFPGKGPLMYVLGAIIVLFLFGSAPHIVYASIMILAWGDSVSLLVGKYYGRIKIPFSKKNLEGIVAGILFASLAASFFVPLLQAFLASLIAMILEAYDVPPDDNLVIPLVAASLLWSLA